MKKIEAYGTPNTGEPKKVVKVEDCGNARRSAIKNGDIGVRI